MQNHPNAMWQRRHERRGWVTAAIAAVPAITSAASSLSGGNAQDQARFATAQQAYQNALNGDKDSECQLKHLTGRYGCATCGRFGQTCGFATAAAKAYCGTLYDQFVQQRAGTLSTNAPIPTPPQGTSPPPVTVTATTGPQGSGVTVQAGNNPPATQSEQKTKTLTFALFGVVIAGALALWFMRKRG